MAVTPTELATHLLAFTSGGVVVYWTMKVRAIRRLGEPMTGQTRDRSKLAVAVIGMAVILVVFGLQVRADNERDKTANARERCLNAYAIDLGTYLTNTLNQRVGANAVRDKAQAALTRAGQAQAKANTAVVLTVAGFVAQDPPTTTKADFVDALEDFVRATARFNAAAETFAKVDAETKATLDMTGTASKPYDPPKVACKP